jgi:putative GTP pyrophosphokinase
VPHVDRIYFRAKSIESFVNKAMTPGDGLAWKYEHPFEQIEDQVAGRVLVFYRSDVDAVVAALLKQLKKAEKEHRAPTAAKEFDYETTHIVCIVTPELKPAGWDALEDPPQTFELQIRTLAQHAWAEPQHGFYKAGSGLSATQLRKMYWAAASAWGIDSIWEDMRAELDALPHRDAFLRSVARVAGPNPSAQTTRPAEGAGRIVRQLVARGRFNRCTTRFSPPSAYGSQREHRSGA